MDRWFLPEEITAENAVIIVGLSGGADSVTLTHLLRFQTEIKVVACHINHHLRGEESDRDMEFVQALCQNWEIPCFVFHAKVRELAAEEGKSLEEAGREERYRFFEELAEQVEKESGKQVYIATAHTLSDNLETVLFRFVRGTGLTGLCGIPTCRGRIIRPLLSWTREDVEDYCKENSLSFVTDSTNADIEYSRNRIRRQVIPELKKVNPKLEKTFAHTVSVLAEDNDFLEKEAEKEYLAREKEGKLSREGIENLHPALRKRLWRRFLKEHHLPVNHTILSEMELMILQKKGKLTVISDVSLVWDGEMLSTERQEKPTPYFENPLICGDYESKTGKVYKIQSLETGSPQTFHKVYKNLFDIFIDCDKICGSIVIRQKMDGDKIKLSQKNCTKTLKKLFQEYGIPVPERTKLFVLADDQGVIGLEGFGVDKRVICDEHTKRCIRITEKETYYHERFEK